MAKSTPGRHRGFEWKKMETTGKNQFYYEKIPIKFSVTLTIFLLLQFPMRKSLSVFFLLHQRNKCHIDFYIESFHRIWSIAVCVLSKRFSGRSATSFLVSHSVIFRRKKEGEECAEIDKINVTLFPIPQNFTSHIPFWSKKKVPKPLSLVEC